MNQFSSFKWSVVVIVLHTGELITIHGQPYLGRIVYPLSWVACTVVLILVGSCFLVTSLNVSQQSRYGFSMETYRLQLWREMGVRSYEKPIPKPSPTLQYAPNPSSIYVKIRWWNQILSKHECLYECLPAFSLEVCEEMVDSSIHQTAFSSLTQQQH